MEKIRLFVILACLLSCSEQKIDMNTSHALPIEFWDIDEETYNEKQVCGITPVCFCQPRNCSDDITLTIPSEVNSNNEYSLLVKDSSGATIDALSYEKTTSTPIVTRADMVFTATNYNPSSYQTWNTTTKYIRLTNTDLHSGWIMFPISNGLINRDITIQAFVQLVMSVGNNPDINPQYSIWNSDLSMSMVQSGPTHSTTTPSSVTLADITTFVNPSFIPSFFGIRFDYVFVGSGALADFTVLNNNVVNDYFSISISKFTLTFNPEDLGFCNQQLRFYIVNDDSPGTLLKKSDCISFKTSHPCTTLIEYRNATDFDGIENSSSPMTTFNLLIPAIFFEEQNTKEGEDIELSNDEIVRLYDKIEEKRLLQIGFMPHYMHRKLLLALSFDFVTIDGKEWIARDEYKKNDGDRHYPLKTASILLTDKNFIKENQL